MSAEVGTPQMSGVATRVLGGSLRLLILALAGCVALVLHSATGHDDSHITYWAAHALAHFGEIVNYNGARLEQSSSLLQTLLLAGLHRLSGVEIPALAVYLSVIAWALAVLRVDAMLRRCGAGGGALGFAVIASSPLLLYWALGGLETTVYIWLLLEASWQLSRIAGGEASALSPRTILLFAAVVLVRPESPLILLCGTLAVTVLAAIGTVFRGPAFRPALRRGLLATGLAALLFALLAGWRLHYFGNAFPQSVTVKMGADDLWYRIQDGFASNIDVSVLADLPFLLVAWIAALLACLLRRHEHGWRLLVPVLLVGAQFCFSVAVGADWMYGARFWAHVLPLMYLCLFLLISGWRQGGAAGRRVFHAVMAGLVLFNLSGSLYCARNWTSSRPLFVALHEDALLKQATRGFDFCWTERFNPVHMRDALFLARIDPTIEKLTRGKQVVTIASGQAGMVMYHVARKYYGKIRFIDRHGLATRWEAEELAAADGYVDRLGLYVPIENFLALGRRFPRLAADVVFDLGRPRAAAVRQAGYRIIDEVRGTAAGWIGPTFEGQQLEQEPSDSERPTPRFFRKVFDLHQFLAVEPGLAERLDLKRWVLDWDALRRRD